ncbi:hypothetical protein G8759_26625 [Spirosoma aureum]|uniref:Dystroglycan-type cadherin-like domain-containing protein n=1 Tax=Spirosoma aureum TaxID=2692134 RepID=A0A6G9AUR4_9BACT|nr:Ig domain-containing protein [Spirosoma aureum]QIP15953.1 hypothetical protein G8759_26625 [Spirosoma aureum]
MPIYTLTEGNLSVPVTLSYDGSGIAVDAAASGVGLNWQLNAGGFISRQVRGYADEGNIRMSPQAGSVNIYKGYLLSGYPSDSAFAFLKDFEPDVFTLSLNGLVISFMLKQQDNTIKAVLLNNDVDIDIQIVKTTQGTFDNCYEPIDLAFWELGHQAAESSSYGGFSSFVVTTTDGLKYYFGETANEREYSFSKKQLELQEYDLRRNSFSEKQLNIYPSTTPTTWRISRIVNPKNNNTQEYQSIKFTYKRTHQRIQLSAYNKSFSPVSSSCQDLPKITSSDDEYFAYKCDLISIKGTLSEITINDTNIPTPTNISSVISGNTGSDFSIYARYDLLPLNLPSTIKTWCYPKEPDFKVTDKVIANPFICPPTQSINHIIINDLTSGKKNGMYLHHNYFDSYTRNLSNSTTDIQPNSRLNLKGIYPIKFNSDGTTELMPGYTFGYEAGPLPKVTSLARDHWGYYNGQDANNVNGTLYNFTTSTNTGPSCPEKSANLDAVASSATVGVLKYIRFPTGGQQGYEYELHDSYNFARPIGGLRAKIVRTIENISGKESRTTYTYKNKSNTASSGYLAVCPLYGLERSRLDNNLQWTTDYYVQPDIYSTILSRFTYGSYIAYENVREEMVNESNETLGYTDYEFLNWSDSQSVNTCSIQSGEEIYNNPFSNLPINACDDEFFGFFKSPSVAYPYVPSNLNAPRYAFWQGKLKSVRIYRVSSGQAELLQETTYNYLLTEKTDCEGLEGGLFMAPTYIKIGTITNGINPQPIAQVLNSASSISGYAQTGTGLFAPAFTVATTALGFASFALSYAAFIIQWLSVFSTTYIEDDSQYYIEKYKTPVSEIRLVKSVARTFNPSNVSAAPIEIATDYVYGSSLHKQVTAAKTYNTANPGNLLSEQLVKYSLDYLTGSSCITTSSEDLAGIIALQSRKALVPIEVVNKRNGRVIGGHYFQYYGISGKEGLLRAVYALELSSPIPSASFAISNSDASCSFSKDANYKIQYQINEYNNGGLATSTKKINEGGTSLFTFGSDNFLPIETKYRSGSKQYIQKYEYHVPLWGPSKITSSDNSVVNYTYDELGRPKAIQDHNNDVLKTYAYNFKSVAFGPAVVGTIPGQYGTVGQQYSYTAPYSLFDYSSENSTSITIDPTGLPSWLVATANTISGTPPADAIGNTYTINVRATGSNGSVTTISYILRISNCSGIDPYIVTGTFSSSTPVSLNAINRMETDANQPVTINPEATVQLKAGQLIQLKPGFTIKPGATFRAYNGPCN